MPDNGGKSSTGDASRWEFRMFQGVPGPISGVSASVEGVLNVVQAVLDVKLETEGAVTCGIARSSARDSPKLRALQRTWRGC